ncbi:unnamed protein product [Closterium sp. NIES-54]
MDSCRGVRPSSTSISSDLSAPLLHPAPPQPCPPVPAASTEADALEAAPFVPLSRDSRPWRDRPWRIAFLFLAILTLLHALRLLLPALRASPGPSAALVALSYARIAVAVVAGAPLMWGVLLYVRRRNSLTVVLPAFLALVALLFFVGAFLILRLPRLLSSHSLPRTIAGPIATAAAGAATSSHALAATGTLAASAVAAARAMLTDRVSSVVDAAAAAFSPSLTANSSSALPLTPSHLASPPLSYSLALLFSSSLSPNNSAPLTSPPGIRPVLPPPFLTSPFPTSPFPPMSFLAPPFPSSPLVSSSVSPPLLSLESNHFLVHYSFLFALLSLAMFLLLFSRPLKRLSLSLLRRTASLLLSHSQSILYFFLLLLPLKVLVTSPLTTVIRKVFVLCAMAAGEGEIPGVCAAWLLPLLTQLANPPLLLLFLLLGLWAVVVFSMLVTLLVAALVGHGLSAQEGVRRNEIQRGKHFGEGAAGDGAAAAYPATAGAEGNAAVAAVPTRSVWSAVHASHVPSAVGITKRPQFSHLPLLGHAIRLVLTRSLGTAAAVAMLLIVLYILFTALNTWLVVYVFASLEVPGLLTGSAAALLTVAQLAVAGNPSSPPCASATPLSSSISLPPFPASPPSTHRSAPLPHCSATLLHLYPNSPRFVVPVAAITGKGVSASLAIALRLLPAHLLPSLALFVFSRMLILALAITTETLLWLLVRARREGGMDIVTATQPHPLFSFPLLSPIHQALWLTPSPLSVSHAWVVIASFTRLFLSSILSTALSTLTLSLLASVPALYVYLALGERLDARTGAVLGKQGQEEEGIRVVEGFGSSSIHLYASAMATPRVLRFDAEGRPLEFSVWLLRACRLLESQVQAHETLWAHASGDLPEPADPAPLGADPTPADSDHYAHERADVTAWRSRDAATCIALSSLLPESEETHFIQVRTASEFLTAIKALYATPTTVSLGCVFLPFLFPDLASFERTADLITHMRSLDSSYRAACTDAQLALLPPPMAITIYFIATSLLDRLASIRDALLLKHPSELTIEVLESALKDVESNLRSVASASGVVPPPLFHGCTLPQLPTFTASLATPATDVTAAAVTTSLRSRGRSGRRGGQGAGGGGRGGGGDLASGDRGSAGAGGAPRAAADDSPAAAGGGDARARTPHATYAVGGVELGGTEPEGVEPGGAATEGTESGGGGDGAVSLGGVGATAGAGGTGGAGGVGPGGARTRGTGAAGAGGVGGAGAGEPRAGGTGAGGAGAGGTGAGDLGAGDTGAGGARAGGAGARDPGAGGTRAGGAGAGGAGAGGTGAGDPGAGGAGAGGVGAGGTGAGGTVQQRPFFVPPPPSSMPPPDSGLCQVLSLPSSTGLPPSLLSPPPHQLQLQLQLDSPLPASSPYAEHTDSFTERREPESRPTSPVRAVRTGRRVPRPRPPPVPGIHIMALLPSFVPLRVPLPPHPASSLPAVPDPESDLARVASPTVPRLLATVVTDLSFESTAACTLIAELVDFTAACHLKLRH